MINVVNIKRHKLTDHDFYCGRGSPLGNPYRILQPDADGIGGQTREEAIARYEKYLQAKLQERDVKIRNELNRIWKAAQEGSVNLVCHCAPENCHANIIKKLIEEKL